MAIGRDWQGTLELPSFRLHLPWLPPSAAALGTGYLTSLNGGNMETEVLKIQGHKNYKMQIKHLA